MKKYLIPIFCVMILAFLMGSYAQELYRRNVVFSTASVTLLRDESGRVFCSNKTGILTWTLPDAEAGLIYTFIDNSATAGDDVVVDCASGDNIMGGTNGLSITNTNDQIDGKSSVTLLAINTTRWIVLGPSPAWTVQAG